MEILLKAVLLGIVAGTVTTSTAIGWGILTMPALVLYFRLLPNAAVSVSVVGFILCALSMTVFRLQSGNIDWPLTLAISVGGVIGSLLGTMVDAYLPTEILNKVLGVVAILAGITLLVSRP